MYTAKEVLIGTLMNLLEQWKLLADRSVEERQKEIFALNIKRLEELIERVINENRNN